MVSSPFFRVKGTDEFCQPTDEFCHYDSVRPQYTVCQFLGTTISGIPTIGIKNAGLTVGSVSIG